MKKRTCPCCNVTIEFKDFTKLLFTFHKRNPFTENEKGIVCFNCGKSILSAEKKNKVSMLISGLIILPIFMFGMSFQSSTSNEVLLLWGSFILLTAFIAVYSLYHSYQKTNFICDDKSSYAYDHERIDC